MSFWAGLVTNVVKDVLSDEDTRDKLIQGSKNLVSSIFDEDGNGELDDAEFGRYCYAESIEVMLMGYVSELSGINTEWIEDYTQGLIDEKFEEDGAFNPVFCENNDVKARKLKHKLNDSFDEKDTLDKISEFSQDFELEEHYFRVAMRVLFFASFKNGEINLDEQQQGFVSKLTDAFLISKLESRSIQREYKNEAIEWWEENL